jgi:chorismate mutase/prephenate dehydratase
MEGEFVSIEEHRRKLDEIDREVLKLLNERAKHVVEIAHIKTAQNSQFYVPGREKKILEEIRAKNDGPLPDAAVESIYREVVSAMRALEAPLVIAYFGPEATFTHLAARQMFGTSTEYQPAATIGDVFTEVERERANYGVVPVENSTEGVVNRTLDTFMESDSKICAEILMEISHHLLANCALDEIKKVYSFSQPFAQCRAWLESNLPDAELVEVSSTARAAKVAAGEPGAAAIASELAAEVYDIKVLVPRIEDTAGNVTRFLVIGTDMSEPSGDDKTSIMFSVRDRVAALYDTLKPFAENGISLSKIESRPSRRKPWEYIFFVDLVGHCDDENVAAAINELSETCLLTKVLGSYACGRLTRQEVVKPRNNAEV